MTHSFNLSRLFGRSDRYIPEPVFATAALALAAAFGWAMLSGLNYYAENDPDYLARQAVRADIAFQKEWPERRIVEIAANDHDVADVFAALLFCRKGYAPKRGLANCEHVERLEAALRARLAGDYQRALVDGTFGPRPASTAAQG